MGLMIHSLGELPPTVGRGYYLYLLDYGWKEPLSDALAVNAARMAALASQHDAVVIQGTVGSHFADEVLSWHHVNGSPAEDILPAIMITTRNPHDFRQPFGRAMAEDSMLLIPLRDACNSATDVAKLVEKIFSDVREKKALADFEISRTMRRGVAGAIVDAVILQPNAAGLGVDLKKISKIFKHGKA